MRDTIDAARKVKLSAAVHGRVLAVLERFRKDAGLRTRSEALCEALDQWARQYGKEEQVERALSKYGKRYEKEAAREQRAAERSLASFQSARGLP